jgi:hypothetical protein
MGGAICQIFPPESGRAQYSRASRDCKSFYRQLRLEAFRGDEPDHLVQQAPRVFVLAVT